MKYLGIRCTNKSFHYAILSGTIKNPQIVNSGEKKFPESFSRIQSLKWFLQELESIFKDSGISMIAIKGSEGALRKNIELENRIENEAVVYVAAANCGIKFAEKKVKRSIAKCLGLLGTVKNYEAVDCSKIIDFEKIKLNSNIRDAILSAWSLMN